MSAETLRAKAEELRAEADRIESANCTGVSASWCPVHGDCRCPDPLDDMNDWNCPLHSSQSSHAEAFAAGSGETHG